MLYSQEKSNDVADVQLDLLHHFGKKICHDITKYGKFGELAQSGL